MVLGIILIIPKIAVKLIGYVIVAVLKILSWALSLVAMLCSLLIIRAIGLLGLIAGVVSLVLCAAKVGPFSPEVNENSWIVSLSALGTGIIFTYLGVWIESFSELIYNLGDSVSTALCSFSILPD